MKILALESSAKAASVAVSGDGRLLAQYMQISGLTHSRTLLSMAKNILGDLELSMADIDAVAVANGPGSFTGIRIGVAAAKGLCWGADKPVIGVSTLEAMAYQLADRPDCVVCPVMDARRAQIYNAAFVFIEERAVRLSPDRAIALAELAEEAREDGRTYFFVGDGAEMCYNFFLRKNLPAAIAPEPLRYQSAWGVLCAARGLQPTPADRLTPNYLRLSQAERERLAKEEKRQPRLS